ncbi:unnamed protein product [Boreogadus saida]
MGLAMIGALKQNKLLYTLMETPLFCLCRDILPPHTDEEVNEDSTVVCFDVLEVISPEVGAYCISSHQCVDEEPAGGTEDWVHIRAQDPLETCWDQSRPWA